MASVGIVVLSWGNPHLTKRCVASVFAAAREAKLDDFQIAVVDNNSPGDTQEVLTSWVKAHGSAQLRLIINQYNAGYSSGMNTGIRAIGNSLSADYYWLLNNDTEVARDSLRSLVDYGRNNPDTDIVGPTIVQARGDRLECAGGCKYYPAFGYGRPIHAEKPLKALFELADIKPDYIFGAAIFLNARFLESMALLDESYFLYYEELELMKRLPEGRQAGWCRAARVFHIGGGASSIQGVNYFKARESTISALIFTSRYYPAFLPSVILARLAGLTIRAVRHREFRGPLAVISGTWEFLRGRRKHRLSR